MNDIVTKYYNYLKKYNPNDPTSINDFRKYITRDIDIRMNDINIHENVKLYLKNFICPKSILDFWYHKEHQRILLFFVFFNPDYNISGDICSNTTASILEFNNRELKTWLEKI